MRAPHIPTPCAADWHQMVGSTERRHCELCNKDVHHLSAMAPDEVQRLLRETPDACVRYAATRTGTLLFDVARAVVVIAGLAAPIVAEATSFAPSFETAPDRVSVEVVDTSGRPVAGLTLQLTTLDGTVVAERTTDRRGQVQVGGLPPGRYRWREKSPGARLHLESAPDGGARLIQVPTPEIWSSHGGVRDHSTKALARATEAVAALERQLAACPTLPAEVVELARMVLEQTKPVVVERDVSMCADILPFLEDAQAQVEAAMAKACPATPAP